MKAKLLLLALLLFVMVGCASTHDSMVLHKNVPATDSADAEYQKLYYDYRALVTETINSNNEAHLGRITDEYISKTGKNIFLITISKLNASGKWNVLLRKTDPNTSIKLPKIHYASSRTVHIHEGKDFVLCESNKTAGSYKNDIHIRIAIKK